MGKKTDMRVFFLVLSVVCIAPVASQNGGGGGAWSQLDLSACSTDVCRLPACFCPGTDAPLGMDTAVIPQIVMFTFDDAVNEEVRDCRAA